MENESKKGGDENEGVCFDERQPDVVSDALDSNIEDDNVKSAEDIEDVLNKLKEAETKAVENFDKFQRTLAEFDNFRKRMIKEKAAAYDDGAIAVLGSILPVIDNFERAISSCSDEEKKSALFTGIDMIYRQLMDVMNNNSMKPIEAIGESFDPNFHSAIAHVDDDSYGEAEIIEDMQKGYLYKDKVLRHSIVKVAN